MSKRLDYAQAAPNGAKALGGVYGYVMQSGLPADLVDLVYLRVSQINNCAYCLDMHTRDLMNRGAKVEKLALVQAWREAGGLFSREERAAHEDDVEDRVGVVRVREEGEARDATLTRLPAHDLRAPLNSVCGRCGRKACSCGFDNGRDRRADR